MLDQDAMGSNRLHELRFAWNGHCSRVSGPSATRASSARSKERFMSSSDQKPVVEAQPLIAVRNVRASSRWYAELLGADTLPDHPHRDVYDRVWRSGRLLLQLHAWDAEDHPNLVNADAAPHGHGVVLWFQVDDFDSAVERARRMGAEIIEEPHFNQRPSIERFGCAMRMATLRWSPVRTVKTARSSYGAVRVARLMRNTGVTRGAANKQSWNRTRPRLWIASRSLAMTIVVEPRT